MIRVAAQIIYCSPQNAITNGVIEIADNGEVVNIESLAHCQSEPESTTFHNGILLPFHPDIQALLGQNLKKGLEAQFFASKAQEIKTGTTPALWILSGKELFATKINAPLTVLSLT